MARTAPALFNCPRNPPSGLITSTGPVRSPLFAQSHPRLDPSWASACTPPDTRECTSPPTRHCTFRKPARFKRLCQLPLQPQPASLLVANSCPSSSTTPTSSYAGTVTVTAPISTTLVPPPERCAHIFSEKTQVAARRPGEKSRLLGAHRELGNASQHWATSQPTSSYLRIAKAQSALPVWCHPLSGEYALLDLVCFWRCQLPRKPHACCHRPPQRQWDVFFWAANQMLTLRSQTVARRMSGALANGTFASCIPTTEAPHPGCLRAQPTTCPPAPIYRQHRTFSVFSNLATTRYLPLSNPMSQQQ